MVRLVWGSGLRFLHAGFVHSAQEPVALPPVAIHDPACWTSMMPMPLWHRGQSGNHLPCLCSHFKPKASHSFAVRAGAGIGAAVCGGGAAGTGSGSAAATGDTTG